jgi:hypothetical protein
MPKKSVLSDIRMLLHKLASCFFNNDNSYIQSGHKPVLSVCFCISWPLVFLITTIPTFNPDTNPMEYTKRCFDSITSLKK